MSDATTLSAPPLAAEFPSASEDDWRKRVEAVLKGADFEKKLVSLSADGIAIAPLYSSESARDVRRPEQTPWTVTQRADHPDTARANEQALDDLNHGATGLHLVFAEAPGAYGFGLTAFEPRSIGRLMANIRIDAIALRLSAGRLPPPPCRRRDRVLAVNSPRGEFGITRLASGVAPSERLGTARSSGRWPGRSPPPHGFRDR